MRVLQTLLVKVVQEARSGLKRWRKTQRRHYTSKKMSKLTPEPTLPLAAKKPNPDFTWPPTEEQLMQHCAEPVQRLNRYSGRPSDREPAQANIETLQSRAPKPRADFYWPPTEERLAAGRHAGTNNVVTGEATTDATEGPTVSTPAASNAASLSSVSIPHSQRSSAVISHNASWIPVDAGQAIVRDDEAVIDAVPTLSEADAPEYVGDSISALAAQSEAAFDGTGSGDWAADLARLQAAIERVTEKVEWRITGASGH